MDDERRMAQMEAELKLAHGKIDAHILECHQFRKRIEEQLAKLHERVTYLMVVASIAIIVLQWAGNAIVQYMLR